MRTVRFNTQAIVTLGSLCIVFLFLVAYFSFAAEETHTIVVRDVQIRNKVEENDSKRIRKNSEEKIAVVPHARRLKDIHAVEGEVVEEEESLETMVERPDYGLEDLIGKRHYKDSELQNDVRRQKVKEMMLHAWNGYKNYSWGANELKPVAMQPNSQNIFGGSQIPATIIDAADTLFLMDLQKEYEEARDHIKENFTMSKSTTTLSVFETTIRILGGLLSLYGLTNEKFYLEKAREVGEALLPAFNTPSGVPKSNLDIKQKYASNYGWANGGSSILAEVGSLHLEFLYLSRMAKAPIFEKKVRKVRDALDRAEKVNGLYPNYINPDTGRFAQSSHMSLGALGDSFYEYLIKSWIQSNRTDGQAKNMYWDVSKAIQEHMIRTSKLSKLKYTIELSGGQEQHKMGHLACFVPGMFALQAVHEETEKQKKETMKLAEELGRTCHESYIRSESHLGPEMFYFNDNEEATSKHSENGYVQRPEVIEGWFYLWRLTGKTKYRDWVWDAVQAIDKHCRVEHGFTGLRNVYNVNQGRDDVQQSWFLAETLKYAYLTFADTSLISLDKWIFNTEAHPFPVLDH